MMLIQNTIAAADAQKRDFTAGEKNMLLEHVRTMLSALTKAGK